MVNKKTKTREIILLDAKKVFERVEWRFSFTLEFIS